MPRPNLTHIKRKELLPIVAEAFATLGYRKATTAELARRCQVQENILYRLWADKKAMFIAAIEYVFEATLADWSEALKAPGPGTPAQKILGHDSRHRGEAGFYKITFAALSETDDPAVCDALARMYERFHAFTSDKVADHRKSLGLAGQPSPEEAAWALLGLATMTDIARTTGLLSQKRRAELMARAGRQLLDGK